MKDMKRGGVRWMAVLLAGSLLAGCATTGDDGLAANDQPGQITRVTNSAVDSTSLPPIGGADGSVQVASADPDQADGTAQPGQSDDPNQPGTPAVAGDTGDPGLASATTPGTAGAPPAGQGSFVSLNDVGKVPNTPGRDLTGGLSIEKLLGGWTVVAGATQCRLNLTYTATDSSAVRYRASAPGCQIATLAGVASWQLAGTQVQLFDDSNALVGALLLSGDRFVGTLAGGQAVSMVG